ncbi:MAG TPA: hypothetical protein VFB73_12675 [Chloroflexota bacterium]|nr:hypothetical protein [Chloroflexota bacterium]
MRRLLILAALLVLAGAALAPGLARAQGQAPDPSQVPPPSELIRQAGYSLTDAEARYLDGDNQVQLAWVMPLAQALNLAGPGPGLPDPDTQAGIVAAFQQILALDPAAAPEAPPTLQRLRELAIEQRAALQRAVAAWLAALQAGDPDWRLRGADDFIAAQQSLAAWQQELFSRYPPPATAQP